MNVMIRNSFLISIAVLIAGCKDPEPSSAGDRAKPEALSRPQPAGNPEARIVTVNGESLTRGALDHELDMITASPQFAALPAEQAEDIRHQMEARVVDRYVSQKLLTAAADAEKLDATGTEVDAFIEGIRETLPEGITLESIMEERGIPMEKLRADIADDIKIRKLLNARTEAVPEASDEQVTAYYQANREMFTLPESVRARHILIKANPDDDEQAQSAARARIEAIRQDLVNGTVTFEAAAAGHSDCPSKERGGDLGTFTRGQMVPAFEEAAFSQPTNAIGPVVETPFGYHIVQVMEKQAAGERSLDEVREEIHQQLTMQERQNAVQQYLEDLREKADIRYGE